MSTKSAPNTSKHGTLLKLLRSKNGASIQQMREVTGWQPHSVRGFLSGTVKKKLGLNITSQMNKAGERRYSISAR